MTTIPRSNYKARNRILLERAAGIAALFAPRPDETIWQFADRAVFFDSTMAPTPGPYRSARTPWTRRLQELIQNPTDTSGRRIHKIIVMKSSQTGFTEAVLNCIRWFARYSPRNVIYAIDSREEAGNISDRLIPTLKRLGQNIFTGDDDDEKRFALKLRHMKIWFYGSFSAGKFANKQAPFGVCDEYEEHSRASGDATSLANLESRMKKSEAGLVVVLSKPKMEGGPIHEEFKLGTQEIFIVPCPHCGTHQPITFESLKFDHCKNLLGEWDKDRVLRETYMKCASDNCTGPILPEHRREMIAQGHWLPTAKGNPGIVSMHISDLYDLDRDHIWGEIALEIINSKGDPVKRMGVYNHRLGLPWKPHAISVTRDTILRLREPYKRGTIPFQPWFEIPSSPITDNEEPITNERIVPLILGGDTQLDFSPWLVGAISQSGDIAVIDWGRELHPTSLTKLIFQESWPIAANPADRARVILGGVDSPYRKEDVYEACLASHFILWPVVGAGGVRIRAPFAVGRIPTYANPRFGLITFNDFDFKCELSIERIPNRRILVPIDIEERRMGENYDIIGELIAERLEENKRGHLDFVTHEPGKIRGRPNHFYDCLKIICLMWRYMNRKRDADFLEPHPETLT